MRIIGIDPGTLHSGLAVIDSEDETIIHHKAWTLNLQIESYLLFEMDKGDHFGCEWVQNYGRVIGEETLRAAYYAGRFAYIATNNQAERIWEPTRPEILGHHCGSRNVPKSNLRQAILDRYGGKEAKKKGNPLHGISNHIWDALAVALYIKDNLS